MRPAVKFWVGVFASLGVVDLALNRRHDGSTLSEVTRELFEVGTPAGNARFTAAFYVGAYVLHRHIVKPISGDSAR